MSLTRKIWTSKKGINALDYIGEEGEIFYDSSRVEFRFSDGVTPGGILYNSGGNYPPAEPTTAFFDNFSQLNNSTPIKGQLAFVKDDGTGNSRLYLAIQTIPTVVWIAVGIDSHFPLSGTGAASQSFDSALKYDFTYSSPNSVLLGSLTTGVTINNIEIKVITPFDDTNALISIGTLDQPESLFAYNMSDLFIEDTFANLQQIILTSSIDIYMTLSPGNSSTGSGQISITYS